LRDNWVKFKTSGKPTHHCGEYKLPVINKEILKDAKNKRNAELAQVINKKPDPKFHKQGLDLHL
jgi:hypothetical protein